MGPHGVLTRHGAAMKWVRDNCCQGAGIRVTSDTVVPYPEVSGYFVPTLLNWGQRDLAVQFATWLVSVQNHDGSWSDAHGTAPYTFDTGQILKGLLALVDAHPEFQEPIVKGCDWMLCQVLPSGQITTPDKSAWCLAGGKVIPEAIHLYALEPLREAGKKWENQRYTGAVSKALSFYAKDPAVGRFDTLSHFHAYIVEALVDLGCCEKATKAMEQVSKCQCGDGAVPAYKDVSWVCSTGLFQYAVIWYKLGDVARGDKAFAFASALQNKSGGFFGGYGQGANYFPGDEISWAVKYFLDALWWKIRANFESADLASIFPGQIDENDGRFQLIAEAVRVGRPKKLLDVGCGKGRFISRLKNLFPETAAYGMDLSERMLASLQPGIMPVQGTALRIPFDDGAFDCAFCVESLEHVVDLTAAVRELGRVIAPGGTLAIIDKNRRNLGEIQINEWEQWFDEEEVARLLRKEGFDVTVRRNIAYDAKDGSDGLLLGWIARKPANDRRAGN